MSKMYGYVRVSTNHQHEDRQLIALREYGVPERNIIAEKQSGKDFDRPGYRRLLRRLRVGDTLVIASLDRLGRDYAEIQEQWRIISKERGVSIVVLDMPLLNTKENAELISQLITDMVLQLLSFVAQTERESIRQRQAEGIAAQNPAAFALAGRESRCRRSLTVSWKAGGAANITPPRQLSDWAFRVRRSSAVYASSDGCAGQQGRHRPIRRVPPMPRIIRRDGVSRAASLTFCRCAGQLIQT